MKSWGRTRRTQLNEEQKKRGKQEEDVAGNPRNEKSLSRDDEE